MKILNAVQIQELFSFTRQHFVEYYDVQTELVDHLANSIEAIWIKNPSLTFEEARDSSFEKFGVFGFMEVVEEKAKQMNKKYWLMVWAVFKEFFGVPQIIITITICFGLFTLLKTVPHEWVYWGVGLGSALVIIYRGLLLKRKIKQRFEATHKKWLLEEYIFNFGTYIGLVNLLFQIGLFAPVISSNILIWLLSFFFTAILLSVYIVTGILPKRADEILTKEYPKLYSVTF